MTTRFIDPATMHPASVLNCGSPRNFESCCHFGRSLPLDAYVLYVSCPPHRVQMTVGGGVGGDVGGGVGGDVGGGIAGDVAGNVAGNVAGGVAGGITGDVAGGRSD